MNLADSRIFFKPVILLLVLAALTFVTSLRGETDTKPFGQTPVWASSKLYAILWMQNSAEYQAVARQAYAAAAYQIDKALDDAGSSALDDTTGNIALKKPAVILDVDETVLRNTPYGAWTIRNQKGWNQQDWWEWCRLEAAEPVPGVIDYIQTAMAKGVHIIYLTNRSDKVATATRNNLRSEGLIPTHDINPVVGIVDRDRHVGVGHGLVRVAGVRHFSNVRQREQAGHGHGCKIANCIVLSAYSAGNHESKHAKDRSRGRIAIYVIRELMDFTE